MIYAAAACALCFLVASVSAQTESILADDYPERYTVVKGDTLWDISNRFLRDPWRWPEVWQGNPDIENPDLIFPGDVLVMTFVDGRPVLKSLRREVVKLSPKPRATALRDAIPPIDPAAIQAYLNSPLVTDDKELERSGYIVDGVGNRLVSGMYDQFYARAVTGDTPTYRVFRKGRTFVDPVSEEVLGYEAVHVGDANMLKRREDVSRLVFTKTFTDGNIRDRLRPIEKLNALPFFYPKVPDNPDLQGVIFETENSEAELGALSVFAFNLGEREGVKPGDVFRIMSQPVTKKDPLTKEPYQIPSEIAGVALVFRTFDKVSYALITNTNRPVLAGDLLVSPDAEF